MSNTQWPCSWAEQKRKANRTIIKKSVSKQLLERLFLAGWKDIYSVSDDGIIQMIMSAWYENE